MGFPSVVGVLALVASPSRLIAVGAAGDIGYSDNAQDWTFTTTTTTYSNSAGGDWDGSRFLIIGDTGDLLESADGASWSETDVAAFDGYTMVDLAWNGSVWCAIAGGTNKCWTSPDGSAWTQRTLPGNAFWSNIVVSGTDFVVVANGYDDAAYSADGSTWTAAALPGTDLGWRTLAADASGNVVAMAGDGTGAFSDDGGASWSAVTLPAGVNATHAAWNGTVWCATTEGDVTGAYSADGETWLESTLPSGANLNRLARFGNAFVAVDNADGQTVYTSLDGETWAEDPVAVGETGTASAAITVDVSRPTGTASASIEVAVTTTGAASAGISVGVISSELATTWSVAVSLAGSNVSSRLTGVVSVRAEEDAARLAEFTLLPTAGVVDPIDWTSAAVSIDFVRVLTGGSIARRIFTGKVDVADFDPNTKQVRFSCTDDLQNVVAALTKTDIDALVGGNYSRGAQGEIDEHWDYAQARLETVPGSLDCNAYAGPRVSLWDGLATWKVFDEGDVIDASLEVELPRRKDICNRVDIAYQYRLHRLRERWASIGFSASIIGTEAYARGYTLPQRQEIEGALGSLGWHIISSAWQQGYDYVKIGVPAGAPSGANSDWWIVTGGGISNAQARLAQRHAQPITEEYTLTVSAPDSLAANGLLIKPLRGALESTWNPEAWESDMTQTPDASAGNMDYAPDAPRADSDAAITALVNMARKMILASHRNARVRWSVPCLPEIDLDRAARIDIAAIDATGKIASFEHRIDLDAGSAITRIGIALSGVAAGGITASDPVTVPAAPDADAEAGTDDWMAALPYLTVHVGGMNTSTYSESLMGYLCNAPPTLTAHNFTLDQDYSFSNPYYDAATLSGAVLEGYNFPVTGFRCSMPGVASSHRAAATLPVAQSYDLAIPEDSFTLSA